MCGGLSAGGRSTALDRFAPGSGTAPATQLCSGAFVPRGRDP
jgi:hypothetical protein